MNNTVYEKKTMKNLRNSINSNLEATKKIISNGHPNEAICHKIFDSNLVAIRKNKVTLTLNKTAYIGMYILELSKVLTYEFHYYYIENKYGNN